MQDPSPHAPSDRRSLILFGIGGHGKVVFDAALSAGMHFDLMVDDEPPLQEFHGTPVVKSSEVPWNQVAEFGFIVAIGNIAARVRVWQSLLGKGGQPVNVIHRAAVVSPHARLGRGNFIAAGAVVGIDAVIEDNCILNTGATVDHDCHIGSHTHLCPGVHLAGGVRVGSGALLGIGVSVVPGITIGEGSTIGAGSTVVRSIPNHVIAYGAPARVKRHSPPESIICKRRS